MDLAKASQRLLDLIQDVYPGWTGFSDPRFLEREIAYKREASAKAKQMLRPDVLQELLTAERYDEFLDRIRKVAQSTNLLYLATPSTGDLAILHQRATERTLCLALSDLLTRHSERAPRSVLGLCRFAKAPEQVGLPDLPAIPACPRRDFPR